MNEEYLEMLKKKILKRKSLVELAISKYELMKKFQEEIKDIEKSIRELDCEIAVQS